ncbi:MAG: FxsA family protein [Acidimicrobiia bacterium]|nr:FxsA family protein [Acidimicrobiia bacterium]
MFSRAALAAFAVILAEFFVFGLAVRAVGLGVVLLASVVAALAGGALIRHQVPALLAGGREALRSFGLGVEQLDTGDAADRAVGRALLTIGGLLLIVPGLLTGAVGALLVLPPIRMWLRGPTRRRLARYVPEGLASPFPAGTAFRRGSFRVDVVDVDVVSEDVPQSAPPELG